MKIFPVGVISEIDNYTIENEPILSINLMERAAREVYIAFKEIYKDNSFLVLAGPGNNGGDALAIARMLLLDGCNVDVLLLRNDNLSTDTTINLERLRHFQKARIEVWEEANRIPQISSNCVVIDGLFGSGLNRPLEGSALILVQEINKFNLDVVSIDIPSGLMGEDNGANIRDGIIRAKLTYSFQFPKLAFLFPENQEFVGSWQVVDIKLNKDKIAELPTNWYLTNQTDISKIIPRRKTFSHKGNMGHVLLIAGSYGKMGAAVLASKACLKSGAGLLTVQIPHATCSIIHCAVPEAMVSIDRSDLMFTEFPDLASFAAVGIGPAIGTRSNSVKALSELLDKIGSKPIVLDADAINILAQHTEILNKLPPKAILTPHPKEFERLVGKWNNDFERLQKAIDFCVSRKVILVLKGAFTTVVWPNGNCHFNTTGNPGMATAGSGDVLTGIILALLGRGINPEEAALASVYIHGLAGDFAAENEGEEAMIASDIIAFLGAANKHLLQ
jgi:NAD(P)H-hydrate epimerase